MTVNNRDSLRTQLIDALVKSGRTQTMSEAMYDGYLWPVLERAMEAGELLVHRNTGPVQKPVHEAITSWLEVVGWTVSKIKAVEPTVSKRDLLKFVYDLDEQCKVALAEAKTVAETPSSARTPK